MTTTSNAVPATPVTRNPEAIHNAFKWAKRKEGVKQKAGHFTTLSAETGKGITAAVKSAFNTACWEFKSERHYIHIGDCYQDGMDHGAESEKECLWFCKSLVWHECCHGHYTTREGSAFAKRLNDCGIPFQLWNLFEDIKIEHLGREATVGQKTNGKPQWFSWVRWTKVPETTNNPTSFLFSMIACEGSHKSGGAYTTAKWDGANKSDGKLVRDFYRQACKALKDEDMIALILKWMKAFGKEVDPTVEGKHGIGFNSLEPNSSLADREESIDDKGREGTEYLSSRCGKRDSKWRRPNGRVANEIASDLAREARNVTVKLRAICSQAAHATTELCQTGSSVDEDRFLAGADNCFVQTQQADGTRRINLFIDMSGSMSTQKARRGAMVLMLAFGDLFRTGEFDGNVILTGGLSCCVLEARDLTPTYVASLTFWQGNEALAGTTARKDIRGMMRAADFNVIITDGCLTSGGICHKEFARDGIHIIGAVSRDMAFNENHYRQMKEYFGTFIQRPNANELASAIANALLTA